MTARNDIAWVACRSDMDGAPTSGPRLCAYAAGDWLVTSARVPVDATVFEKDNPSAAVQIDGNPYSHLWDITHAPTGLRAHTSRDLWRAILVCEEFAKAFDGLDPTEQPERNKRLRLEALKRAEQREVVVREAFDAYNARAGSPRSRA